MKLVKSEMRSFFYQNDHASLCVFNNKFYGVNSLILHKLIRKWLFWLTI